MINHALSAVADVLGFASKALRSCAHAATVAALYCNGWAFLLYLEVYRRHNQRGK